MSKINRREFLYLASGAFAHGVVETTLGPFANTVEASPLTPPSLPAPVVPHPESLEEYLTRIAPVQKRLLPVVASFDLFDNFKNLARDKQVADFNMYFPMYWAAKEKYEVPWQLLWINHVHETAVSRDENPGRSGYHGAMQRSERIYDQEYVADAIKGWEKLAWLEQRYPDDYREIFFAAKKLRLDADQIRKTDSSLSLEQSILEAQKNYCRLDFARQRIARYEIIKPMFDNPRAAFASRGGLPPEYTDEYPDEEPIPPTRRAGKYIAE